MRDPRVAVVTGAAGGIGRAVVEELCGHGFIVEAIDNAGRTTLEESATVPLGDWDALAELISRYPEQVSGHDVDVTNLDALRRVCEHAVSTHGKLDVCVAAAAAIDGGHPLWEMSPAAFGALCEVNITGVWNAMAVSVPHMLRNPSPHDSRFVAIASAAAHTGLFGLAAYGATKHAVVGLVQGLAADLIGTGITAVAVSPGATRTRMLERTASLYGFAEVDEFGRANKLQRILEPEEVAKTVVFCCSPEAGILNGSVVLAAGGVST